MVDLHYSGRNSELEKFCDCDKVFENCCKIIRFLLFESKRGGLYLFTMESPRGGRKFLRYSAPMHVEHTPKPHRVDPLTNPEALRVLKRAHFPVPVQWMTLGVRQ